MLYTDGAIDLPPPHGLLAEQFSAIVERGLDHAATAEEMAEWIRLELERVLPFDERTDDIALLVLHLTGPTTTVLG